MGIVYTKTGTGKIKMRNSLRKIIFYLILAATIGLMLFATISDVAITKVINFNENEFDSCGIEIPSMYNLQGINMRIHFLTKKQIDLTRSDTPFFNFQIISGNEIIFNRNIQLSDIPPEYCFNENQEFIYPVDNTILRTISNKNRIEKSSNTLFIFRKNSAANNIEEIQLYIFGISSQYKGIRIDYVLAA